MPTIDFSNVKGMEPVAPGEYLATIVSAQEGISSNQNEKIDLQWKIEEGENNAGRVIFDTLTFTEASAFRVKNTMLALDFPKNYSGDVTPEMFLGKSAYIVVDIDQSTQIDEETGEPYPPRNRVKKVKSLSRASAKGKAK